MVNRVEQVLAHRRTLNRLQTPRLAIGTSIGLHLLFVAGMVVTSVLSAIEEPIQYVGRNGSHAGGDVAAARQEFDT